MIAGGKEHATAEIRADKKAKESQSSGFRREWKFAGPTDGSGESTEHAVASSAWESRGEKTVIDELGSAGTRTRGIDDDRTSNKRFRFGRSVWLWFGMARFRANLNPRIRLPYKSIVSSFVRFRVAICTKTLFNHVWRKTFAFASTLTPHPRPIDFFGKQSKEREKNESIDLPPDLLENHRQLSHWQSKAIAITMPNHHSKSYKVNHNIQSQIEVFDNNCQSIISDNASDGHAIIEPRKAPAQRKILVFKNVLILLPYAIATPVFIALFILIYWQLVRIVWVLKILIFDRRAVLFFFFFSFLICCAGEIDSAPSVPSF